MPLALLNKAPLVASLCRGGLGELCRRFSGAPSAANVFDMAKLINIVNADQVRKTLMHVDVYVAFGHASAVRTCMYD